ncbi:hypothetical protein [Spirillospora sp. CA-294931]|uniref:hypothetical protein n=1 Tax=Spirillospora sp. CA-294931 TaxID=3240042 RepID=UPI003D93FDBC
MSLSQEPFQRVYSPPEPPAPKRRPKAMLLVAAVAVFALAAGAVFFFLPSDGERAAPPRSDPPTAQTIGTLPAPCGTVAGGTVQRLIPGAQRRESSNSTLTTCTFSSTGSDFRWLRVEAHLYAQANTETPLDDAKRYFGAQFAQARSSTLERTVSIGRHPGLGDEAYRWFKADRGQPTVVGQVTARVRNAVVTVSYSEQVPGRGDPDEREQACLGRATDVAREVLTRLR